MAVIPLYPGLCLIMPPDLKSYQQESETLYSVRNLLFLPSETKCHISNGQQQAKFSLHCIHVRFHT